MKEEKINMKTQHQGAAKMTAWQCNGTPRKDITNAENRMKCLKLAKKEKYFASTQLQSKRVSVKESRHRNSLISDIDLMCTSALLIPFVTVPLRTWLDLCHVCKL